MNWSPFPPHTQAVQMDEDWSFVYKKEAHCDPEEPADLHCGDDWDHTAVDPESRLLLSLVPGKRTAENCQKLVDEVQRRTGGRTDATRPARRWLLDATHARHGGGPRQSRLDPSGMADLPGKTRVVIWW